MENKKTMYSKIALSLLLTLLSLNITAQVSRQLDIPGRLQWDNANGYCGETSIQMIGLYFGNYISQNVCRTVAGGELLIADNDEAALDNLSFTHSEWDYNQSTPQYQNYLVWVKQQLFNCHPVIITVYVQGMSDPDYDHIIPAIGFSANDTSTFNNTDQLLFNDCYDSTYYTRTFQSMWDTRSMSGNGASYEYCIPKNVDYGCAVTGIKDIQQVTKPVQLSINRWDEPNVTLGESPVQLNATATISDLNIGSKYALLRYNNYTSVPSSNFNPLNADEVFYFTAASLTKTYNDTFMSNTAVFYRCIPYNYSGISESLLDENSFNIYPNPINTESKIYFDLPKSENVSIKIYDLFGKEVLVIADQFMKFGKHEIPLCCNSINSGTYICCLKTNEEFKTIKVEIEKN
jgi:hypothetical protein